ncbi:Clp protease N-terminal domain-containing protein [Sphaerisporangium rubeum]|uniref:ATP-dependent Clp protease ATP-binding subunit ClpA n=1 Tax=Sphaerisporangium rubeum TaxID=321317 RepID=A0A7X0IJ95_9ACTN|nr:Clp protease N-terminal domain-containing protein [Sphaerisporangium rubeum]MBB6476249.1 ATP-dependent Clp protease ATP-binding subunit ClpA [Sphaerisporangium rubeum]
MFERFTQEARQAVVRAQEESKPFGHSHIGTEHLLLALLHQPDSLPARVLQRHGVTHTTAAEAITHLVPKAEDLDAEALSSIGIDLDAIREKVEAAFGPGALDRKPTPSRRRLLVGHTPFTSRAKKVLELSLREAIALKHREITSGHLLLGLIREGQGLAAKVLTDAHVDLPALRQEIKAELR